MRKARPRPRLLLACAFALAGCNDHRYGFFGDTEGAATSVGETTEGPSPTTTVTPTTVSPTTTPTTITTTTESTATTATTATTIPSTVTSATATTGVPGCGSLVLPSQVPVQGFASLVGQPDSFGLSCGTFGGSDVAFLWRAPFTGRFRVDTAGSTVDTIVGALDSECAGLELACADDSGPDLSGQIELDLLGGQVVTFVVDSFGVGVGDVVLNIAEVPVDSKCPDGDFGTQLPLTIPGQTAGAPNVRLGSCGGFDAPEIEALWTAPVAGFYRFEIVESDFDPLMYLLFGACDAPELACSADGNGVNPVIDVFLDTVQPVVIVVDGQSGTSGKFTLSVTMP